MFHSLVAVPSNLATPLVVSIPINAVAVLGMSLYSSSLHFCIPFSLHVLIMRVHVHTCICLLGWIGVTGHTNSCGVTISKVKRGGESTR